MYTIEGMSTALLHMLKYIPGAQEMYEEAVIRNPYKLKFVPDYFKTQKIREKAVRMHSGCEKFRTPGELLLPMPSIFNFIPDHLKTQEMCEKAVEKSPRGLNDVPDLFQTQEMWNEVICMRPYMLDNVPCHFKTQEMCEKAVELDDLSLIYAPDCFVTQQKIGPWDEYCNNEIIKSHNGYQKRKAEKEQIKNRINAYCLASITLVGLVP